MRGCAGLPRPMPSHGIGRAHGVDRAGPRSSMGKRKVQVTAGMLILWSRVSQRSCRNSAKFGKASPVGSDS